MGRTGKTQGKTVGSLTVITSLENKLIQLLITRRHGNGQSPVTDLIILVIVIALLLLRPFILADGLRLRVLRRTSWNRLPASSQLYPGARCASGYQ